jgi:hypothetical protein
MHHIMLDRENGIYECCIENEARIVTITV